jgi:hypothetical protein
MLNYLPILSEYVSNSNILIYMYNICVAHYRFQIFNCYLIYVCLLLQSHCSSLEPTITFLLFLLFAFQ